MTLLEASQHARWQGRSVNVRVVACPPGILSGIQGPNLRVASPIGHIVQFQAGLDPTWRGLEDVDASLVMVVFR